MSDIRHMPVAPTGVERRVAGERVERHRHDDHQLVYVSTGVLAVRTPVGRWVAASDRAVWLPGGTWHEHRFHGASTCHTVGFGAAEPAPLPTDAPAVVAVSPLLRELLVACTDATLRRPEARRVRAVVRDQLRRTPERPFHLPEARDERLAVACARTTDDLARAWPLATLAREAGVGERTLSRLFRDELGMTYPQWRTNVRVYEALVQLARGASVTDVGQACGWATTSAFVDTFRRVMGRTPGAYRAAIPVRSTA